MTDRRHGPKLQDSLTYPPRGMNADRAAAYCDMSKSKFLEGVANGTWPPPKDVDGMPRWDRLQLDQAWDALDNRTRKRVQNRRRTLDDLLEAEDDGQGGARLGLPQ